MKSLPADLGLSLYRFLPLIAWAVVSLVPPQIAVLAWLLWKLFGILVGYPVQKAPGLSDVLGFSALIAEATWPFLVLHFVTRWRARKRWPEVGMIKVAMCGSAIAMVIPSLGITLEMPRYMLTAGWNPHEPASLFLALALISPVAGITGWALGSLAGLGWRSWVQPNDRM